MPTSRAMSTTRSSRDAAILEKASGGVEEPTPRECAALPERAAVERLHLEDADGEGLRGHGGQVRAASRHGFEVRVPAFDAWTPTRAS